MVTHELRPRQLPTVPSHAVPTGEYQSDPPSLPRDIRSFEQLVQNDLNDCPHCGRRLPAVERGVRRFVPQLAGRSQGSVVVPPRNGWTSVYDELSDRDPSALRRIAPKAAVRWEERLRERGL